jgi:hypothetical protein
MGGHSWTSMSQLHEATLHLDLSRFRTHRVHAFGVDSVRRRRDKDRSRRGLSAFYTFQKFAERHLKGSSQSCQVAETDLARTSFEVRYMNLMNTRLFGKVDLPPTPFLSELPDSFAKVCAHIRGHSSSIDLVETLYLVDALSREIQVENVSCSPGLAFRPGLPGRAGDRTAVAGTSAQPKILRILQPGKGITATRCGLLEEAGNDDSL